jgi:hypothetical protein
MEFHSQKGAAETPLLIHEDAVLAKDVVLSGHRYVRSSAQHIEYKHRGFGTGPAQFTSPICGIAFTACLPEQIASRKLAGSEPFGPAILLR